MERGYLATLGTLLLCSGLAFAQPPASPSDAADAGPPLPDGMIQPAGFSAPAPTDKPSEPGNCASCGNRVGPRDYIDSRPPDTGWFQSDFLIWWIKDGRYPALFTTSTSSLGILGTGDTSVLLKGDEVNPDERYGGRFTAGIFLDDENLVGIEGGYLFLGSRTAHFGASSAGTPVLARPFFNVNTGAEDAELIAAPGIASGSASAALDSRLQGAEGNLVFNATDCCGCRRDLQFLIGFRWLELAEGLELGETILPTGPVGGSSQIDIADRFSTHNNFYGGQLGVRGTWYFERIFLRGSAKLALGDVHETFDIQGTTRFTLASGAVIAQSGGLLALPTNSGHYSHDDFAVLPEATAEIGYLVTDRVRVLMGYTFLYLSDVARPGDQIDRAVNPTQLPTTSGPGTLVGSARPLFASRETSFWAQGIHWGLEIRY